MPKHKYTENEIVEKMAWVCFFQNRDFFSGRGMNLEKLSDVVS